ncbi:MAG TPA: hypothetical protein VH877_19410 [Polyangia bacterium]|jgi:hypothetical protein|nr:hypothetical protein [Polyangia bacterium]
MRAAIPALLVLAAAVPARAQPIGPGPEGWPPGAIVRPVPPPPEPTGPCTVDLSLKARRDGAALVLTARARNRSSKPVTLYTPDYCGGGGPALFVGLRPGYDAYNACSRGPCLQPRGVTQFTIPPGATQTLTEVTLHPDGDGCNAPLPPGRYAISFELPHQAEGVRVCAVKEPYRLVRKAPPAKIIPPEPSPPPPIPHRPAPSRCPPPIPCGIYCPYGMAKDENGCSDCSCNPNPLVPPPSRPPSGP